MVEYELQVLSFPARTPREDVRRAVREHVEYGRWELYRTRVYVGGRTRTWLRRRVIRPARGSLTPSR